MKKMNNKQRSSVMRAKARRSPVTAHRSPLDNGLLSALAADHNAF